MRDFHTVILNIKYIYNDIPTNLFYKINDILKGENSLGIEGIFRKLDLLTRWLYNEIRESEF